MRRRRTPQAVAAARNATVEEDECCLGGDAAAWRLIGEAVRPTGNRFASIHLSEVAHTMARLRMHQSRRVGDIASG